jgi:PKD repeat protein
MTWTLGDGREAVGATVSHAYAKPGIFDVTLTVADETGLACGIARDSATITALARE